MPKLNTFSIAAIAQAVQNIPQNQRDSIESYLLANTDRTPPRRCHAEHLADHPFPHGIPLPFQSPGPGSPPGAE